MNPPHDEPFIHDDNQDSDDPVEQMNLSPHVAQPRTTPAAPATEPATLRTRRTLIPVLLTLGAMMITRASAPWLVDEDSVFADVPRAASYVMLIVGALTLVIAAVNMRLVRRQIDRAETDL